MLFRSKGSAPIADTYIQARATIITPSLEKNTEFLGFSANISVKPSAALASIVIPNAHQQPSPKLADIINGSISKADNTNATLPNVLNIIL